MNAEKVVCSLCIVLGMTLNLGFFRVDLDDFRHHSMFELVAAIFIN